jgi:hypothetical protein
MLAFTPLMETLLKGTFSLFLLGCWVSFYRSLSRGNQISSTIPVVFASLKPQSLVLQGAIILASKRWLTTAMVILCVVIIVVTTSIFWGWHIWYDYCKLLMTSSSQPNFPGIAYTDMHNMKGLLVTLFGVKNLSIISLTSLVFFLLAILYTIRLWRVDFSLRQPLFGLQMANTLSLGLITSLHLNSHDSLQIILPVFLLYDHLRSASRSRIVFGTMALAAPSVFFVSSFMDRGGNIMPTIFLLTIFIWSSRELTHVRKT